LLIKHEVPYEVIKNDTFGLLTNPEVKIDQEHLEAIAHTRKAQADIFFNDNSHSEMDLEQIKMLREEKTALD
jgi:hypothetical protein